MLIISSIVLNCMLFGAMFRPLEHPKKQKSLLSKALTQGSIFF